MGYVYEKLIIEREDKVVVAAINNPPANALAQGVLRDLNRLLDEYIEDDSVRVIIITGTGQKLFSAGADITEFGSIQSGNSPGINGNDLFFKIQNYPKVIIAALQGSAYGGGLEMACACHLRIMADDVKIGLPEVKLGIMPGWGGTQRLTRHIGQTRALEMMLTGDPISAREAMSYGLVNRTAPAGSLLQEAKVLASKLAAGAPIAQRGILKAVVKGLEATLEEGIYSIEAEGIASVSVSEDAREGAVAFFQKRPPNFIGR